MLVRFRASGGAQDAAALHATGARRRNVRVLEGVHGGASEHALAAGDVRLHRGGGCQRSQKLLSNRPCGQQSVFCIVQLARATSHFIPQLSMQMLVGDLHASAISILAHIDLLGVSVPDVWKKRAECSYSGTRFRSRCFRARFYIGGR